MFQWLRRLLRKGIETDALQAVRGNRGYWHGTFGDWGYGRRAGLWTLCYEAVSPQGRQTDAKEARYIVDCPRCLERLVK